MELSVMMSGNAIAVLYDNQSNGPRTGVGRDEIRKDTLLELLHGMLLSCICFLLCS